MTDIQRIFHQEHRALAEEGSAFATDFPEAARYLDPSRLEDRDPYVERLIEGSALLTARVRETLESEEDGLTRHLLDLIAPDLEQPLPSVCVMEFHPRKGFPSEVVVPAGSEVLTASPEDTKIPCRFTVNHDVAVRSIAVAVAKLHMTESGATPLELELASETPLARGDWPDRIPFYLHGDPAVVWAVRFALLRRNTRIQIRRDQGWEDAKFLRFRRLDQPGYSIADANPGPFSDARDFFCADDRFRFLELSGAGQENLAISEPLRITVHFSGALPRGLSRAITPELFRPHAAVVVNRFQEQCQSILWDHTRSDALVVPQAGPHREILDVVSVQGLGTGVPARRTVFHRYSSYRSRGDQPHYQILRRRRRDGSPAVAVSLGGFRPDAELQENYLAILAECSDGSLPHDHLQPAEVGIPGRGVPEGLTGAGLTRPSTDFHPPAGSDPRSRLLAFAAGHFDGWLDTGRLKDGLRQVLWDPSESKRTLIESIQEVVTENGHVLVDGIAWREMRVTIRLRDTTCTPDTWDRLGVIDAFGSVLLGIVRDATPIGSLTRLRIVVDPAGVSLEWAPGK